jgi:hypothetical protein
MDYTHLLNALAFLTDLGFDFEDTTLRGPCIRVPVRLIKRSASGAFAAENRCFFKFGTYAAGVGELRTCELLWVSVFERDFERELS